jgi:hypothetical protein
MIRESDQEPSNNGHSPTTRKKKSKQAAPRASYEAWSPDFGFVPQGQPLPFGEAIRQLPRRYRFILSKPGFTPFLAEMSMAEWKIVWWQLLVYALLASLLAFLRTLINPVQVSSTSSATGLSSPAVLQALNLGSSLGLLLFIPVLFFFAMGLLYLLARIFGGHGIFVQQAYTTLLFLVPCGVVVSVLGIIPVAGSFLSTFLGVVLFVYCVALQCFAATVVHQMPGGKATTAVVITMLALIPMTVVCLSFWTLVFAMI